MAKLNRADSAAARAWWRKVEKAAKDAPQRPGEAYETIQSLRSQLSTQADRIRVLEGELGKTAKALVEADSMAYMGDREVETLEEKDILLDDFYRAAMSYWESRQEARATPPRTKPDTPEGGAS